jgi:hypothetical protein
MKLNLLVLFLCFLTLFACKKPEDRNCIKSVGDDTEKVIIPPAFDKILLHEKLEFVLVQDSVEKIVLKGGKNLLNFVKIEMIDGVLDISNTNKCHFLRTYKRKILVEIHFINLSNIHFEGTETLTNIGLLQFNWLSFLIRDGAGQVNLNFNAQSIDATISHGWGDFTFTGTVNQANINVRSNGYCDTYGLQIIDSLTVISKTQGSVRVNSNGVKLKAQLEGDGNIYYRGIPSSIQKNKYGNGELIEDN